MKSCFRNGFAFVVYSSCFMGCLLQARDPTDPTLVTGPGQGKL